MRVRAIGQVQQPDGKKVITHAPGAEFSVSPRVGEQLVRGRHAVAIPELVKATQLAPAPAPVPVPVPAVIDVMDTQQEETVLADFPDAVVEPDPDKK